MCSNCAGTGDVEIPVMVPKQPKAPGITFNVPSDLVDRRGGGKPRKHPRCVECNRFISARPDRDPMALMTIEERHKHVGGDPRQRHLPRCSGCARPFRLMVSEHARQARTRGAVQLWSYYSNGKTSVRTMSRN
jgi:hypothetical protein